MKILTIGLLTTALTFSALANGDIVVAEETDTIIGKGVGGWAGVLIGGAAGGPLGALAMGVAGAWAGGEVQEGTGQSARAYRVKLEDGREKVVRSPKQTWQRGDNVEIVGNRLVASTQ